MTRPFETFPKAKLLQKKAKGFSLVEIMTVMAIVTVLVSFAVVESVKFRKQANESNCIGNLKTIATAFEIYAAGHGGAYAAQEEVNLQFLVSANYLPQDLIAIGNIGNFNFVLGMISPGGYDIRAMARNTALADHNYQITTGGQLKRSGSSKPGDEEFFNFN
ncbi:MAG: prepilin-type N-terminal cleavage/methylation domain-containing protein [Candidatus Omnitrophota bacterium]